MYVYYETDKCSYTVNFLAYNKDKVFNIVKNYKRLINAKKCLLNLKANYGGYKNITILTARIIDSRGIIVLE